MADLTISIVAGADLGKRFKHAGADARHTIRHTVNSMMLLLASVMRANIAKNFTRRTGELEHVVLEPVRDIGPVIEGKVGSPAVYAAIHEFGGEIHAKNVAHLTIPLDAMLTARGVARGTARDVIENPGSYGFDSTFAHNDVIFGNDGGSISALFTLKESVRIPERPYARPAMEEVAPVFASRLKSAFSDLLVKSA